jgi:hypothetical protein
VKPLCLALACAALFAGCQFAPEEFLNGAFMGVLSHNSYDTVDAPAAGVCEAVYSLGGVSVELDVHAWNGSLRVSHAGIDLGSRPVLADYLAGYASIEKPAGPLALIINEKTDTKQTFPLIQETLAGLGIDTARVTFVLQNPAVLPEEVLSGLWLQGGVFETGRTPPYRVSYVAINYALCNILRPPAYYIAAAHDRGCPAAFWNHPDNEAMWEFLYRSGADYIKTDRLAECVRFIGELERR